MFYLRQYTRVAAPGSYERVPSERIATAETGEAAEVGVVGVDLCLILHRQRGDMCVRHEIGMTWGKRNHSRT